MKRALILLVLLAGCAGDQANRQKGDFGAIEFPRVEVSVPKDERTPAALAELSARQDQTTQALTGLGAQVREVNVRQDVQFDALAKVQVGIQNDVSTVAQATVKLESQISNVVQMQNELRMDVSAELKLNAQIKDLSLRVDALTAAQGAAVVGFNNRLDQVSQNLSAGRDVNNTQFTSQMASTYDSFIGAFVWTAAITAIVAIVVIGVVGGVSYGVVRSKEASRQRAESREREARERADIRERESLNSVLEELRGREK